MFYTVGHSTLTIEQFAELIRPLQGILDVRAFPGSRRFPHFAREAMARWLAETGIDYDWLPVLGGRRSRVEPGPGAAGLTAAESGWRDRSFANYSLYTTRPEWLRAMEELIARAGAVNGPKLGLMCAEALWWRCHRSIIADYLVWRGFEVWHLRPGGSSDPHSRAAGDRLARYHPAIIGAWQIWRENQVPTAEAEG